MTDDHHTIGDAIVRLVDAIEHDEPQNHEKNPTEVSSDPTHEGRINSLEHRVDDLEDNILGELRGISRDRETVEEFEARLEHLEDAVDTITKALQEEHGLGTQDIEEDTDEETLEELEEYRLDELGLEVLKLLDLEEYRTSQELAEHFDISGNGVGYRFRQNIPDELYKSHPSQGYRLTPEGERVLSELGEQDSETSEDEDVDAEAEDEDEPFFKEIKPSEVGWNERKNAIAEYLKERQDEEGKFYGETIPTIIENVFGVSTLGSQNPDYKATYNAINDDPRVEEYEKTGEKNTSKYRANPRLK